MNDAYIVEAVRTPMGKKGGTLSHVHPEDLAAHVLRAVVERAGVEPRHVEDVIMGCVTPVSEQGWNIGRLAALTAGFPVEVPGQTVNRMCGSSLETANQAARAVQAGAHDLLIAAGVESMSRVPMGSDGGPLSQALVSRYQVVPQGISAELIAERWGLSRQALDEFSLESHRRAVAAIDAGKFEAEIAPLEVTLPDGQRVIFDTDETPRRNTSLERMASLLPAFKPDGVITAGSSSQISDGAAALLVASGGAARRLGLRRRARFVAQAVSGVDPVIMLTGPIPATQAVLAKAGLRLSDMDVIEINEAFASVVLAWGRELGPDMARVNSNGGAIALGHPLGATGARLITTALHELERTGGRYALITMCIGFGMGLATIIERVEEGAA